MKKNLLTILTTLAITQGVYSQSDVQQLSDIEKAAQEINGYISQYQKTEKVKEMNGNQTFYKAGDDLKLVTVHVDDFDANKKVEWYFANGQLIYSQKVWTDKKTNSVIENEKCYLKNGKLVSWTRNDKPVDTNAEELNKVSADLIAYACSLISQSK